MTIFLIILLIIGMLVVFAYLSKIDDRLEEIERKLEFVQEAQQDSLNAILTVNKRNKIDEILENIEL